MSLENIGREKTLEKIYIGAELKSFSIPHGNYEVREIKNTSKSFLPENMIIEFIANDNTMNPLMIINTDKIRLLKVKNTYFFSQY